MNFSAKIGRFTRKTGRNEASILSTFDNFRWGNFFDFCPFRHGDFFGRKPDFLRVPISKKITIICRKYPIFEKSDFRLTMLPIGEAAMKSPSVFSLPFIRCSTAAPAGSAASALPIGLGNIPSDYKTRSERSGDAPAGCMRFFTNQR